MQQQSPGTASCDLTPSHHDARCHHLCCCQPDVRPTMMVVVPRHVLQGGWGIRDGDHTMLASKPLAGYRCMACDRPLGSLDASPGPFLPTGALPVTLPSGADLAAGPAGPAGARVSNSTVESTASHLIRTEWLEDARCLQHRLQSSLCTLTFAHT